MLVQHVVLGINAHINLDLAVAAAQTTPGKEIAGLERDFERINDDPRSTSCASCRAPSNELSPLLGGLDVVLGRLDEEIFGFKLERARAEAWEAAVLLAGQTDGAPGSGGADARPLRPRPRPARARPALPGAGRPAGGPVRRADGDVGGDPAGWTAPSASERPGYRPVAPGGPRRAG